MNTLPHFLGPNLVTKGQTTMTLSSDIYPFAMESTSDYLNQRRRIWRRLMKRNRDKVMHAESSDVTLLPEYQPKQRYGQ